MAYRSRQRRTVRYAWKWDRSTWLFLGLAFMLIMVAILEVRRALLRDTGRASGSVFTAGR
jgi:hypothetical protein